MSRVARLGGVVLFVFLAALLLVANAWAFLRAPWGASALAAQAERQISEAVRGTVRIGEVGTFGALGFRLVDVFVLDPDDRPVIAVRDLRVRLAPHELLLGRIAGHVAIQGARVAVVQLPAYDDVNVGLAFEPVHPGPERERRPLERLPPDPPLPIELRSLRIDDAAFLLADAPGAPPQILVEGMSATGEGRWTRRGAFAALALEGLSRHPVDAPLSVDAEAAFAQNWLDALRADVELGTTSIRARGRGEMLALEGRVQVAATVGAAEARAWGVPLASDLAVDGDVWLDWDLSSVALRAAAPDGGVVAVDGWYAAEEGTLFAQLIAAAVDPATWWEDAPAGQITASARARGRLLPEADLDLELLVPAGTLAGAPVGPATIAGRLEGERLLLAPSRLQVPGATIALEGAATVDRLDLGGRIDAWDLGAAARFGASLLGEPAPPVGGRGQVRFQLRGPPDQPEVELGLDLELLSWGDLEARRLALEGQVALDEGGLPVGRIGGTAGRLRDGRFDARNLRVEAERDAEGRFSLDATGRTQVAERGRPAPSRLRAEGRVVPGEADLDRFRFDFPEGRLEGRGRLRLDEEGFALDDFELEQRDAGRLRARGTLRADRLDLELRGTDVRLEQLPQALLPADVSGRIDVDATLQGTLAAPEGDVHVRLRRGRIGALRDVAGEGDARFEAGRVVGQLRAAVGGAGLVAGSFDVPVDVMGAPPGEPLALDLRVGPVDLGNLGRALGEEFPPGRLRGRLVGSGTMGAPTLDLQAFFADLQIPDAPELPPLHVHLAGQLEGGSARLDVEAWAAETRVLELVASAPFDPRRFRRDAEAELERMLASREARASGMVRGLDLALVGGLLDQPDLRGAMAADIDVRGPIVDPRGTVRAELRGGPLGPVRQLAVSSAVELSPDRSRLVAAVALEGQPPAEIWVDVAAPPRQLLDGTAPPQTGVELVLDVPELDLAALGGRRATGVAQELVAGVTGVEGRFGGTVGAAGRFAGTLAQVRGELRVVARDLVFRGVALGGAEVVLAQDERARAWAAAIDPAAGTLVASVRTDRALAPLTLLQEGGAFFEQLRGVVEVEGEGLSLAPLAVSPEVNRADGVLFVRARAEGPLVDLDPVGEVTLRDGFVELVGGPRYQGITLDARLTGERMVLARLDASAPGRGRLTADGRLERLAGAPDPFLFEVEAREFPIGGPGGVSARISGEGELRGTVHPRTGIDATFEVPQARIALPSTPPRELQTVSRLRDVVIVTGPEARRRERRQRQVTTEDFFPVRLQVTAPRRVFVVGEDVDAELEIDLALQRDPAGDILASGEVRARRGRVRVLGRTFVVEEAAALWGGWLIENPQLSLTARYEVRDVTAWVDVSGRAREPTIGLRSEPPLPESQVALLIASGRTALPGQTGFEETAPTAEVDAAGTAVSVAGSFAAQRLRQALGPRLPLDVLTLETAGERTRLEAGTYVSERLYLGYLRNFFPVEGENRNEVRAEYELSRAVSVESRFGDRGAAGVDLVWERRIATPAQQRARREAWEERMGRPPPDLPDVGRPPLEEELEPGPDAPAVTPPGVAPPDLDEERPPETPVPRAGM